MPENEPEETQEHHDADHENGNSKIPESRDKISDDQDQQPEVPQAHVPVGERLLLHRHFFPSNQASHVRHQNLPEHLPFSLM